jgi:hypothetical protein
MMNLTNIRGRMSLSLAATWFPRGELNRLKRLLPDLRQVYDHLVVIVPPQTDSQLYSEMNGLPEIRRERVQDWSWGRYYALKASLEADDSHVQYADLDRLLRWVERLPDEWQRSASAILRCDCLIFGRTPAAYATHPQALIQTERISNRVVSQLLRQPMDVSAGSKGFSRKAAEYILAHSKAGHALGTDAEWPLLAVRAGYKVEYLEVDGLDWESADRYQMQAAGEEGQRLAAQKYDQNPQNWKRRVDIAFEIINIGLKTMEWL